MADERLKRLIARRGVEAAARETLFAKRKAITDIAEEESRDDLSVEEDAEFRTLTEQIRTADAGLTELDARIQELSDEAERERSISDGALAVRRAAARVESISEAATYQRGDNSRSYFRDLMRDALRMDGDGSSRERLQRHAIDVQTSPEYRDLVRTDGNGGYFVPPAYLMSQYVELARASRVYANQINNQTLPGGTDSINIPKVSTGTTTAAQTADNAAVSETDMADALVTAGVKTIAGQQDVAIQLLDQSPVAFDQVIFNDLLADYAAKLDVQTLNGSNANGQVKGTLGATGINAITYTDTTPTVGELYPKIADGIQQVHTGRFQPATAIFMHPRRWAWITAALDSTNRPLVAASGPGVNQIAAFNQVTAEGLAGQLQGLPVYLDANIPTNLGTGTDEDRIIIVRASDILLYESSVRSRVLPDVGSGTLTVRLQVYGYLAFTAERAPKAVSVIAGTGLVAPTF